MQIQIANLKKIKKKLQMAEKHLKKCPTFLVIRERKIKNTLELSLALLKMAKIMVVRMWNKSDMPPLLEEGKTYTVTWKSVWQFLRKMGINLP